MARIIPSFIDEYSPPGEHEVFNLLADGPENWTILHSLDLAPVNRGLRTEIDFLVIVPDAGVLCIEVKSHENIAFDGQQWHPKEIKRSPFKQALDGRYAFRRRLVELAPHLKFVPIVQCCIFPRAPFDLHPNLSVQPWELIDCRTFRVFRSGSAFCGTLKNILVEGISADANLALVEAPLSKEQIETIARCCVPFQKRNISRTEELKREQERLESILRAQQKPVLQLAELNPRVIVSGAAGTGKTLIAMGVARRVAKKDKRVAFLAFNQLVSDWIRTQMAPLPNLVCGRAIQVMARMCDLEIPENPSAQFWENDLPKQIEERMTDPDFTASAEFDYIVLDEAQDFLARPRIWECLTCFLKGGLEKGAFILLGDFTNQVLSDRPAMDQTLATLKAISQPCQWHLAENCRNYRLVGDTAVALSGLVKPVYAGYLRVGGEADTYDICFYDLEKEQLDKLAQWLKEFKVAGFKPNEITILSFRKLEMSAAFRLKQQGFALRPFWQAGDFTGFTSIHAFKGLENKVIILTDVVFDAPDFHRNLFYVGLTRATAAVRVLCDSASKQVLGDWIRKEIL